MPDWSLIISQLEDAGVQAGVHDSPTPVSGGDISAAWRLRTESGDLFVKTAPLSSAAMFAAESEGLAELAATGTIRTPVVRACSQTESNAYLALEWLDLGSSDVASERKFGEQLAALHHVSKDRYGWHRDNSIGLTPQINTWSDDWVEFFAEHRLEFQLRLAVDNGFSGELQEQGKLVLKRLSIYFDGAEPEESLLHGDLWSGNRGYCGDDPVIFDPAVYYGDRETDIAMTKLFGGFSAEFYTAYETVWPLRDGHQERVHLYQLYHVLNHLNLFGSAYLSQTMRLMRNLL